MLKSKKIKALFLVLVIFAFVGMIGLEVYATDNPINLNITGLGGDESNILNETSQNQVDTNQQTLNTTVIQPTTNTEGKLPKTGVTEDITVMFFIIVCAISAVYAYKKIKDYNM